MLINAVNPSVIHYSGRIGYKSFAEFKHAVDTEITVAKAQSILLLLSSYGGEIDTGFAFYTFLRSLPVPVFAVNVGNVDSSAVSFFLGADHRFTTPGSTFLVHPPVYTFNSPKVTYVELKNTLISLDGNVRRYLDIFNERTQGTQTPFNIADNLTGAAKVFSDAESVKCGISHAIIPTQDLHLAFQGFHSLHIKADG